MARPRITIGRAPDCASASTCRSFPTRSSSPRRDAAATRLPFSMNPVPPNILTSRMSPAPARTVRTLAASSCSSTMLLSAGQQLCQLIDCTAPAPGMALDRVDTRESLVANEELATAALRCDDDGDFRLNGSMFVGRLYDPGKDYPRGRPDDAVRTRHDDGSCARDLVGEAVRAAFAEIELEHGELDFGDRFQPARDQLGPRKRVEHLSRWMSKASPDFGAGVIRGHRPPPPAEAAPADRQRLPRRPVDAQPICQPLQGPCVAAGTDGRGPAPFALRFRLLPAL